MRSMLLFIVSAAIRKDYPLIGVLKLKPFQRLWTDFAVYIRKDYPLIGVLKHVPRRIEVGVSRDDQEGLPDYWGIEINQDERRIEI